MIIPFFLMRSGCPHQCIFCNEQLTSGNHLKRIEAGPFEETVRACLGYRRRKDFPVQIAFYGGTFTGMTKEEQIRLLRLAAPFLKEGTISSIRISTRPDEIEKGSLELLKDYGVTTIEIGAQSLNDDVLFLSQRGHNSVDTCKAVSLLKSMGFKTGIHLMTGLHGDTRTRFSETIEKTISLHPDTVRIHPTLVLRNTPLADAFQEQRYLPITLTEAVEQCKEALKKFHAARIEVIRMGLQTTRELEEPGAVVAGPFHPAFKSLVESSLFLEMAMRLLDTAKIHGGSVTLSVAPAHIGNLFGYSRFNYDALKKKYDLSTIAIVGNTSLARYELVLLAGKKFYKVDGLGNMVPSQREDIRV